MKSLSKINCLIAILAITIVSCTKLKPETDGPYLIENPQPGQPGVASSLSIVYQSLNQLCSGQSNWIALEEHTSDELMGPTRGTDWDDFGTWRKLHAHTWDASHNQINDTWNGMNGALYQTTLLAETSTGQTQAEAKFLRAYFSYIVCDLYGQVQHRPASAPVDQLPEVYSRSEACDFIISELESIVDKLPSYNHTNRNIATKEAAEFLLAKTYLNKAVFKQDPSNPAGPYTFDQADMNKVITYCNQISANTNFRISDSYWDNFKWDNGTKSTEDIFVRDNPNVVGGVGLRWYTSMGLHYNHTPSSWNGFTTLSDFYNSFSDDDIRKSDSLPGYTNQVGAKVGFLVGLQKGPSSGKIGDPIVALKDRSGNPLVFTPDVSLFYNTETKGIRTNKYPLDPSTINDGGWSSSNEFVFFRFADVRLMKAEAILRGGTDPQGESPLSIVNQIRQKRGLTNADGIDLNSLLLERGHEMYLEGWRRNDLIRFGAFNQPNQTRPDVSEPFRVVFPIPNIALSSNPNLHQNFGY